MDTTLYDPASIPPLQQLGVAASAALTDGMIERLVATGSSGIELLDRLNDPDTKAAVHCALDGLTALHRSGGLDTLFEILAVAHAVRAAATDGMVERLTVFVETIVTNLATEEVAELARDTERAFYDAAQRCSSAETPQSLWGVMRCLFKPETVRTLNLLLAFGSCMQDRATHFAGGMKPIPRD
jgi:uncharacterized protein YjgD (DUF1641 family)